MSEYQLYRDAKLKSGAEFQDFVMERLHRIGIVLQTYSSRIGQLKGENLLGLEIKNDEKMATTGNVCIEIAEKARPREGNYAPSGIFRTDNTWLYGIGDRKTFYIFAKSTLKNAYAARDRLKFRPYETPTSRGFLIPSEKADQLYCRKICFDWNGDIASVSNGGATPPLDLLDIKAPDPFQMRFDLKAA